MSAFKIEADIDLRRDSESQKDVLVSEKKGTQDDQKDMHRMVRPKNCAGTSALCRYLDTR
jgi:hypothetical protein